MNAKPLRILVVEYDRDTRENLVDFLVSLGHWVESCAEARTALERMNYDGLDVLLTDVWLPDEAGWNYLDELSKRGTLPPMVISMSGRDQAPGDPQSHATGCQAHFTKPIAFTALEAALAPAVG